jgi:hypothetical protein
MSHMEGVKRVVRGMTPGMSAGMNCMSASMSGMGCTVCFNGAGTRFCSHDNRFGLRKTYQAGDEEGEQMKNHLRGFL